MDKVSVVVIAGLIIAAVAAVTLGGDPKPATSRPRRHRAGPAHRVRPDVPDPESPRIPAFRIEPTIVVVPPPDRGPDRDLDEGPDDDLGADDDRPDEVPGEPQRRSAWVRLRAGVLLVVTVVVLGGLAAGLLGIAVLVGYRVLDGALG